MKRLIMLGFLSTISQLATGQEYARILAQETVYEIESEDDVIIRENYTIRVENKEGHQYGMFIEYFDKFRKIKNIEITIKDASGNKVKKLNKADGTEYGFNQSYEIDDSKIFVISPDFRQYPFTMEVEYEVALKGFISLPEWMPRSTFNLAVDQATLKIVKPTNLLLNIRAEHLPVKKFVKDGDHETLSYDIKDLAAIPEKTRYKDFYDAQAKVLLSPEKFSLDNHSGSFSSWQSFGDWFLALNSDSYELSVETRRYIDSIDKSDNKETIRAIYNYMQDRVRYISIQLGIGGYKSISTEDVEAHGYGDCKALTTYMKNMLDYAGIESNYILVQAGRDVPDVIKAFPSNQFNHVYLGIPSTDTLYLECTSQTVPAFYTGQFTDDRNVLWIASERSEMIRSKVYSLEDNRQLNAAQITVEPNGDAVMDLEIENHGVFYDELGIHQSGATEYIEKHNHSKFWFKDFSIVNYSYSPASRDQAVFTNNYFLKVPGYAQKVGDRLVVPMNSLNPIKDIVDESALKHYASIPRAISIEDSVVIKLPENYWIYNIPEKYTLESQYGTYEFNVSTLDNGDIEISRRIKLVKGDYSGDAYDQFNTFFRQLVSFEKKKLVLNAKT